MTKDELILLDLPREITTPRLFLRVPQPGDGALFHQAMQDGYANLVKWLNWPKLPASVEACEKEAREHAAKWTLREDMRFMCFRKDTGDLIGRLAFPGFLCVWDVPLVEISYFIAEAHQRQGFASEAVNSLCQYAFDQFQARKLQIHCDVENVASWKIPEKLHFEHEATQRGIWPREGNALAEIRTYACFDKGELPQLEIKYGAI